MTAVDETEPWTGCTVENKVDIVAADVTIPAGSVGLVIATASDSKLVAKFGWLPIFGREDNKFTGLAHNVEVPAADLSKWYSDKGPLVKSVPPGQPLSYAVGSERMLKDLGASYRGPPYVHRPFKAGETIFCHFGGFSAIDRREATVLSDEADGFVKVQRGDSEGVAVADFWMPEEERKKRADDYHNSLDRTKVWNEQAQQWEEVYKIGERVRCMFGESYDGYDWEIGTVTSLNPLMVDNKEAVEVLGLWAVGQHVKHVVTCRTAVILEVLGDDGDPKYKIKYDSNGEEDEESANMLEKAPGH
eukprot:TRINITY_DN29868_c0_g1_i1.p1 TRINITY_DN29868_c0_g1~~TRINITY_DN29868_c0_g1_i1.p1  ORF type:complete len:303 (+),score=54.55 TRINITY_DN29868_c0_g1_i1:77-985(+)